MSSYSHPSDSKLISEIRTYERAKNEDNPPVSRVQNLIINFIDVKASAVADSNNEMKDLLPEPDCWASFIRDHWEISHRKEHHIIKLFEKEKLPSIFYDFTERNTKVQFNDLMVLKFSPVFDNGSVIDYLSQVQSLSASSGLNLVFLPMITSQGVQVFILSHFMEYNMAWVEFMLSLNVNSQIVAEIYHHGSTLTVSPSKTGEKVAWFSPVETRNLEIGAEVDHYLTKTSFSSKFLGYDLNLAIFLSDVTIIGDYNHIIPELYDSVQFYYFIQQYFREINPNASQTLECDIFNHLIYHDPRDPLPLRADDLSNLNDDFENLIILGQRYRYGTKAEW